MYIHLFPLEHLHYFPMMAECFFIWSVLQILFHIIYCLTEGDKNVCFNWNLGEYYCCAYFEEKNGTCVECQNGFKSIQGQHCEACQTNFYGKRCLSRCHCFNWQRCDNIEGCVEQHLPSTNDITTDDITTKTSTLYTISGNTSTSETEKQTSTETTVFGSATSQPLDATAAIIEETGISKTHLMLYSGTVTGIVFILGACHFYFRFRPGVRNKKVLHRDVEANDHRLNTTTEPEVNEGIYHTIDESKIVELTENTNPYLEVIDSSGSSEDSNSITSILGPPESGYLHPYNSLIVTTEIHVYEKRQSTEQTRIKMAIVNEKNCSENENQSQTHSSQESDVGSSGTENGGSDNNGYLNPQTDNENIFDLSVFSSKLNADAGNKTDEGIEKLILENC